MPAEELGSDAVPLQELVAPAKRRQRLGSLNFVHVRDQDVGRSRLVRFVRQQHTHFLRGRASSRSVEMISDPDGVFLATVSPSALTSRSSQAHINPVRSPKIPTGSSFSRDYHDEENSLFVRLQLRTDFAGSGGFCMKALRSIWIPDNKVLHIFRPIVGLIVEKKLGFYTKVF